MAEKESIKIAESKALINPKNEKSKIKNYIKNIQDILEINILKNRLRIFFKSQKKAFNLDLFNNTIFKMKEETERNGGRFTFVYVPSWDRFFNSSSNLHSIINLRGEIIKNLENKNIDVIDTTYFFSKQKNLIDYYPLGYVGHFNKKGYKKVADILKERILN